MELLVEKKLANSWAGRSKIFLTHRHERIYDLVYDKKDLLIVNSTTRENELVIKEYRGWSNIKYSVVDKQEIFNYKEMSSFKMHYQFISDKNSYDIFGHKKFKYSIFKNGLQIGFFIESSSSINYKILYRIECDSDANIPLIFSFLLVMNMRDNENSDGAAFTYKISPFWKTKRDFDMDWKPK
jgi:hypothetical protein